MIREESRFFTDGGEEFRNLQAAKEHEAVLSLAAALDKEFGYFLRTHSEQVAEWLMEHYTLEPKEDE